MFHHASTRFHDRTDAGRKLADHLQKWKDADPLVIGIPRGGVIVAAEVARALKAPLGVIVIRKVGAPFNPELAIGAVTESGNLHLDNELISQLGVDQHTLTRLISEQQDLARRRYDLYSPSAHEAEFTDRTVILVDDGLATGTTMSLAAQLVKQQHPRELIVAVPVGSRTAVDLVKPNSDEVVCPMTPRDFGAVGEFYEAFWDVSDAEVLKALNDINGKAEV